MVVATPMPLVSAPLNQLDWGVSGKNVLTQLAVAICDEG
jgi:hypothetical protein